MLFINFDKFTAIVNRSSTAGTSGITREMMSAAVQQAIASTSTQNSSTSGADVRYNKYVIPIRCRIFFFVLHII